MKLCWPEIEIAMAEKTLSGAALAKEMGITATALGDLRRRAISGETEFGPETVGRIAKALGVDVRRIIADPAPAESAKG